MSNGAAPKTAAKAAKFVETESEVKKPKGKKAAIVSSDEENNDDEAEDADENGNLKDFVVEGSDTTPAGPAPNLDGPTPAERAAQQARAVTAANRILSVMTGGQMKNFGEWRAAATKAAAGWEQDSAETESENWKILMTLAQIYLDEHGAETAAVVIPIAAMMFVNPPFTQALDDLMKIAMKSPLGPHSLFEAIVRAQEKNPGPAGFKHPKDYAPRK